MRTLKLPQEYKLFSQEVIDLDQNILLKLYQLDSGFGFRYITYENGKEIDPIKRSDLSWIYGPIPRIQEARDKALELYSTLIQK